MRKYWYGLPGVGLIATAIYYLVRFNPALEKPLMAFGGISLLVGVYFLVMWFLTDYRGLPHE